MSKIGIIGATGMIGHHTANAVIESNKHELFVIHRESSDLSSIKDLKYQSRVADLMDKESLVNAFKGLDYVLNCGAYYPTTPKPLKAELTIAKSQMANFLSAINASNIKQALYLGAAIAIPIEASGEADESKFYSKPPPNKAAYVQVKWLMDKMAREAGKSGTPIVIGIPSMTFGEYDYGPSTGQLIVYTANQTIPGYVEGNRNVIYAGDAGKGLLLACINGKPGERYLLTGENITMEKLVRKIAAASALQEIPKQVPIGLAKFMSMLKMTRYKIFGGEMPLLNDTAIAVMSAGQYLRGDKAQKELGFKPTKDIDETLAITVAWFKDNGYITNQDH